jgi:hypothetical protein
MVKTVTPLRVSTFTRQYVEIADSTLQQVRGKLRSTPSGSIRIVAYNKAAASRGCTPGLEAELRFEIDVDALLLRHRAAMPVLEDA